MSKLEPRRLSDRVAKAAETHNREEAEAAVDELVRLLRAGQADEAGTGAAILQTLRGQRWFDLVARAADALINAGLDTPPVRRHLIQALLDQESKTAALLLIEKLITDTESNPEHAGEHAQAWGLRGRACKQLYVDSAAGSAEHLREAIASYRRIYDADPTQLWHGINTVAVVRRAREDEISGDLPDDEQMAKDILAAVREADVEARQDWDLAIAGEACVALGKNKQALKWYSRYAQSGADAFALQGTIRQLEEVWRLRTDDDRGALLLPVLRSALLSRVGGGVETDTTDAGFEGLSEIAGDQERYEAILGVDGFQQVVWFQAAMARAQSVAIVESRMGNPQGTAFVMTAGSLWDAAPDPDTLLLVTNAHVVSTEEGAAVHPDDAVFRFELGDEATTHEVGTVRWSSPKRELDITVIEPQPPLVDVEPMPVARAVPRLDERVYVIGHPGGRRLSFSLYDNRLLNYAKPLLHYRTPTEGGSSGSPVLNKNWELIGLHHVGGTKTRVPGEDGLQPANEGISFEAIVERGLGAAD